MSFLVKINPPFWGYKRGVLWRKCPQCGHIHEDALALNDEFCKNCRLENFAVEDVIKKFYPEYNAENWEVEVAASQDSKQQETLGYNELEVLKMDPKSWKNVRAWIDDQLNIDREKLHEDMNQGFRDIRSWRDKLRGAITEFLVKFVEALSFDELMELADLVKQRLSKKE